MDTEEIGTTREPSQSYKALAAEHWFGYGRWAAPYWFVGMEPGGEEDARVYQTWHELGAPEILDFKAHSEKCEDLRWIVEHPPLQTTWKQLIRIALGYEGAPTDTEDIRRYQRDRLGRSDGDTLLIELSAINAPSLSIHVAERESHRAERIARNPSDGAARNMVPGPERVPGSGAAPRCRSPMCVRSVAARVARLRRSPRSKPQPVPSRAPKASAAIP